MWKVFCILCLLGLVICAYGGTHEETKSVRTWTGWSKVGLAWSDGDSDNLWALAGNGWNKVSWIYTWSPDSFLAIQQAALDFVPMLWGTKQIADFQNQLKLGTFASSSAVLGPNEPDQVGQANLTPAQAVSLWDQYIQPLKSHNLSLGAPAVSSDPNGKVWLTQFLAACTGCTIDFIPLHWYGSDGQAFIDYVTDIHTTFGKNIWITEWACVQFSPSDPPCDQQSVYNFMGWTTDWLDQQNWVERWAWFGAMRNLGGVPATDALLTPDGQNNTALGVQYAKGGHS